MTVNADEFLAQSASGFQVRVDGEVILFVACNRAMTYADGTWFRKEIGCNGETHLVELFVKGIEVV